MLDALVRLPGIEAPRKSKCDYVTLKVHPNLYQKLYSAINFKFLAPIDNKQSLVTKLYIFSILTIQGASKYRC